INISKMFVIISRAVASADRIMEVIETPDEVPSECCARRTEDDTYIRFEHVTFAYGDAGAEPNLTDISFALKKGETLGIIGATGSGKSTLAALLMRFYEVSQGSIYIEGTDIRALSTRALREKFGVVFQNDTIFEDSIAENVRMGRTLTEDDIRNAVAHAKAKEFVEEAGRGYDNHINVRGANLSGGQKQRILIARALAAHPDILILDDSSSALDYKTDAALRHELAAHYADTTKLIIAQRVSSILHADHIIVLEDGKMIGYGTHEELLERCEVYREIRSSQM
ncbi:MAG: ABC transporter ATP-binding protein/permease, partial [Lachnospiraceae bacterium]|nr:ABC transporter ATP-binding protein/permease [Lachnospiraceae bacterium]